MRNSVRYSYRWCTFSFNQCVAKMFGDLETSDSLGFCIRKNVTCNEQTYRNESFVRLLTSSTLIMYLTNEIEKRNEKLIEVKFF